MDRNELNRRIEAGTFAADNGRVLRTVNILKGRDISVKALRYALPEIEDGPLAETLFYLQDAGYLSARDAVSRKFRDISEGDESLRVRLTAKGMQLLKGYLSDPAVRI